MGLRVAPSKKSEGVGAILRQPSSADKMVLHQTWHGGRMSLVRLALSNLNLGSIHFPNLAKGSFIRDPN